MSKFKVGDKVRRISVLGGHSAPGADYNGMKVGDVDEVIGLDAGLTLKTFGRGHGASNFELHVEPVGFKPGDRVRRVKPSAVVKGGNYVVGAEFIVSSVDRDGDVYDQDGGFHGGKNIELLPPQLPVEPAQPAFKVGDRVQRKLGKYRNAGKDAGVPFIISEIDKVDGWVRAADHGGSHMPENLEFAPPVEVPNPFSLQTESTTTVRLLGGEFVTSATDATIEWKDSDSDGDILVTIDGQFMKVADLRQAADLFRALADKLEGVIA